MGRAEKRMAKKRSKKGPQYTGGRPINAPATAAREDKLPKSTVAKRLGEVPVFGLRGFGLDVPTTENGWLAGDDGSALFYVDAREAERAATEVAASLPRKPTIEGVPLDTVFWNADAMLKASETALQARQTVPSERSLVRQPSKPTPALANLLCNCAKARANLLLSSALGCAGAGREDASLLHRWHADD